MKALIIFLLLFTALPCRALELESVLFNYKAPGSVKIKYTGLKRVIIDEIREVLEDEWKRDANLLFRTGDISFSQYRASMLRLSSVKKQYGLNGNWWTRGWYHSLMPKNNGAPYTKKYTVGRMGDIIDLGIAKVNENFRFKFKEYSTDISNRWHFRFKPQVTGNTKNIISRATVSFIFEYSVRKCKLAILTLEVGYKRRFREFVELRIEMLNL